MTMTFRTGVVAGGLLGALASAVIVLPVANADPQQQCNSTVGQTVSQTLQSYLDRHPDVKRELTDRSQAEGGGTNVIDYLNRHPDVRQHLVDLANKCTP
jgi:hypothetical protein